MERELEVDLRDHNDRVRFVLLARIGAARDAVGDAAHRARFTMPAIAAATGRTPSQLRREIDDLRVDEGDESGRELIADICRVIGDSVTAHFAQRSTSATPTPIWEIVPTNSWWAELQDDPLTSPLMAVVAARVLEGELRPLRNDPPTNASSFESPVPPGTDTGVAGAVSSSEWFARRRLARSLLRAATTGSGHALEAQVMLERLCPVLLDDIMEFVERSPRWLPIAHVLDRALRSAYVGDASERVLAEASAFVLGDRFVEKLRHRTPRSAAAIRLVRRVALNADADGAHHVARRLASIATDDACAIRARRYALWSLAEVHAKHREPRFDRLVSNAVETLESGRSVSDAASGDHPDEFSDLIHVLRRHAGGYLEWGEAFGTRSSIWADPFDVDLRNDDGQLAWPMSGPAAALLTEHLGASKDAWLYESPWDRVPRRLVPGARRLLIEMLIHPGLVRTKAAADTILQSGPVVLSAASRALCGVLRANVAVEVLPHHIVEGAIADLGYFRHESALETLCDLYRSGPSPDVRAASLMSVGAVLTQSRRGVEPRRPKHWGKGIDAIRHGLSTTDPVIAQAAIHAAAGIGAVDLAGMIGATRRRFPTDRIVGDLADWCLDEWEFSHHRRS